METTNSKMSGTLGLKLKEDLCCDNFEEFKTTVAELLGVESCEFYLTFPNGKLFHGDRQLNEDESLIIVPRLLGGKGGFGSMLRAIGAQIEKTTNRDACRDLSGRRLRDINEEQRLKRWFSKQQEREQEKAEAKKRKLEKLKQFTEGPPLPKIEDPEYNKIRAEMADSVYAAVDQGFEQVKAGPSSSATATVTSASSDDSNSSDAQKDSSTEGASSSSSVAPITTANANIDVQPPPKKKVFKKTMLDEDLDSGSSSESDDETAPKKAKISN